MSECLVEKLFRAARELGLLLCGVEGFLWGGGEEGVEKERDGGKLVNTCSMNVFIFAI